MTKRAPKVVSTGSPVALVAIEEPTFVDIQDTVRDGLQIAAELARGQLKGYRDYVNGNKVTDIKQVMSPAMSRQLADYAKTLAVIGEEERRQVLSRSGMFAGMSDEEVAELAAEVQRFVGTHRKALR